MRPRIGICSTNHLGGRRQHNLLQLYQILWGYIIPTDAACPLSPGWESCSLISPVPWIPSIPFFFRCVHCFLDYCWSVRFQFVSGVVARHKLGNRSTSGDSPFCFCWHCTPQISGIALNHATCTKASDATAVEGCISCPCTSKLLVFIFIFLSSLDLILSLNVSAPLALVLHFNT